MLGEGLRRYPVELFALTLMPNHWHLILRPEQDSMMGRMLRWVTATHTQRYHAHWRWTNKADREPRLLSPWPIARTPNWLQRVNESLSEKELGALRQCVSRGRPYGNQEWTQAEAQRSGLSYTLRPRGRPRKSS
ncbi:hypothetical protein HOV93_38110 [Planctomycetes bacterium FF15]|uniref:Transposase IS200-like domain-containing protein n=1 Tax=Bremerella alba TaxID=980252 RepID=A0A7V8V8H0_9BACT|nr:hypothetical protein [Bremerella alba]